MVALTHLITDLLLAATVVSGAAIERRDVINHDAVVGFPETVPSTTAGSLFLKYKPFIKVFHGCVSFPAVDALGNTNGGLAPKGSHNGGCSKSLGQVYARGKTYNGRYAIMYSWYMPKDSPSTGLGHRHEWENIVVWLSSESTSASIVGMSISGHGKYETRTKVDLSGNSPLVGYNSIWPVNHQMVFTSTKGGQQPLIAWDSLTPAARTALDTTNFEAATVPFKDSTFDSNLAKAVL